MLFWVDNSYLLEANVEFLLKLADYFDIPSVTVRCEKRLLKSKRISDAKKLLLVDMYHLNVSKVCK